jgi:hypothetical protein
MKMLLLCLVATVLSCSAALGGINVPSDGSDGALHPTTDVQIDLSQAATGTWNQPGNGRGVYDPDKWAVVFKYSSVAIPEGVTITFKNHPSRAPVVWLVQSNVTIAGTVSVCGHDSVEYPAGLLRFQGEPGPGGFRGGATAVNVQDCGGEGLGPGGGPLGSVASYDYGNAGLSPILGGSGVASDSDWSGGGGGGAILIAAGDTLTLTGSVAATGGSGGNWYSGIYGGGASGGGIRLVADKAFGSGSLLANGGSGWGYPSGGPGRVRLEVNVSDFALTSDPWYTYAPAGTDPDIWLPAGKPRVKVVSLGGLPAPADPKAGITYDTIDFYLAPCTVPRTIVIQADNVPLTWKVGVRVCPTNCTASTWVDATYVSGDESSSIWQADLTLSEWYTVIQVRASEN